jgi:hypothetical protein
MILQNDPLVAAYWKKHAQLAKNLGFTFDPTPAPFDDKTLLTLRNEISRACATIQNKWSKPAS